MRRKRTSMKKILKPFLVSFLSLVLILLFGALGMPKDYVLEQSIEIKSSPIAIRALLSDFSKWSQWSPWYKSEPSAEFLIEGPLGEIGSGMKWKGRIIGQGQMNLNQLTENNINIDMQFEKPRKFQTQINFIFREKELEMTTVTWKSSGKLNYPFDRLFGSALKSMISKDMEKGLFELKIATEASKNNDSYFR
jgi:hypothetical protein